MKYVQWARVSCAVAAVFALVCTFSPRLHAQSTTAGAIGGLVADQSKAAVPGATVTVRSLAINSTADAVSDANGRFSIINLPPGVYSVEVSLPGFASYKRDNVIVEVGRTFRLSGPAMVRRILLPAVMPAYVIALRSGLGLGWMFVIAAEFMGASEGLGYLLIDGQQLGKPAEIVAAILAFAVLGKLTDTLLVLGTAPFLRWQDAFAPREGD